MLDKLRSEQNDAAKEKAEWKPSDGQKNMPGSELHTVDSDLLHQGDDITWLERVTAQVLHLIVKFYVSLTNLLEYSFQIVLTVLCPASISY